MEDTRSPDPAGRPHSPARDGPRFAPGGPGFLGRVVQVVAIVALAGLALTLLVLGIDILFAAFAGVLLAVLLHAFGGFVARHTPLPYRWSLTVVVLGLLLLLGLGGWLLAPQVAEQADELREQLPAVLSQLERRLARYGWGQWLLEQLRNGSVLEDAVAGAGGSGLSVLSAWSSYLLLTVSVGLFAAANPKLYIEGTLHLVPPARRARVRRVMDELGHTLRWWLIGQAIAMVVIGVSTTLVLWAFGIPLAIVLGLIVGLLGFIPYIGPLLGAIPVALIAVTAGPMQFVYVMLAYAGVQLIEGYVATPLIQHRMVYLPPAFTITLQILLGAVLGVLGVMFATPLAAVLLVLTRFYRTDLIGDAAAAQEGPGK